MNDTVLVAWRKWSRTSVDRLATGNACTETCLRRASLQLSRSRRWPSQPSPEASVSLTVQSDVRATWRKETIIFFSSPGQTLLLQPFIVIRCGAHHQICPYNLNHRYISNSITYNIQVYVIRSISSYPVVSKFVKPFITLSFNYSKLANIKGVLWSFCNLARFNQLFFY